MVILLPIVGTVVIAVVIGALLVVQHQRQADQVSEADMVAQDYLADVGTFRASFVRTVNAAQDADAGKLKRVVDRALARTPKLAEATTYGMEHSNAYAEARRVESTYLEPYRALSETLGRADVALEFIVAARKVLDLRATDYVGFGYISSSGPVRSSLIPAFVKARDEFDEVPVPKGQQKLARTVHDAVQYVIDQATLLADRIDARQNYSFGYSEQFDKARDAVREYATVVDGDVTEAINAVTADS
jgi:hypothetical protein